jgi:hypothetical protein
MITVAAPLQVWTGEGRRIHYLSIPERVSEPIRAQAIASPRGSRSVKVLSRLGDIAWRTSLFPIKSGGYFLPMRNDVCTKAGISAGDEVTVTLELV